MKKKKSKFSRSGASVGAVTSRPPVPPPASTAQAALATLAAAFDDWADDAGLVSATATASAATDASEPGPLSITELTIDLADEPAGDQVAMPSETVPSFSSDRPSAVGGVDDDVDLEDIDELADTAISRLAADPGLILFTTGTPLGGWQAPAESLFAAAPVGIDLRRSAFNDWLAALPVAADGSVAPVPAAARTALAGLAPAQTVRWGGVDAQAVWVLDALAEACPQARFLFFVASPAAALAACLAGLNDSGTPEQQLAVWRAGAERLLRHSQRHPGRCLFVNAAEATAEPEALAALCGEVFGLDFAAAEIRPDLPGPQNGALAAALAAALVATDRRANALYAELTAACEPLSGDDEEPGDGNDFDATEATRSFRAHSAAVVLATKLAPELERAQESAAEARAAASLAGQQLAEARSEAAQLHIEAAQAAAQHEEQVRLMAATMNLRLDADARRIGLLLRQVGEIQVEFDAVVLKARGAEVGWADAEQRLLESGIQQRAQIDALSADRARLADTLAAVEAQAAERKVQAIAVAKDMTRVIGERDNAKQLLAERAAQAVALGKEMARLTAEREDAKRKLAERVAQAASLGHEVTRLTGERDEAVRLRAEWQAAAEVLTRDQALLVAGHDEVSRALVERQAQVEALALDRMQWLAERDAAFETAEQRGRQIEAAEALHRSLRQEVEASMLRFREMQEDMERDYLELIGERDAAVSRVAERQAELDLQAKARARVAGERDAAAALVAEQRAQIESLAQAQARLTAEREDALRQLAERGAELDALARDQALAANARDIATALAVERQAQADTLTQEHAQLLAERELALTEAAEHARQMEAERARQDSLRQENEMLLLHLHEVQEEMERYYLEARQLAAAAPQLAPTLAAEAELSVGDVIVGTPRETPPHLELEFHFHQLSFGPGNELPELRLRLVEHHGKPGLTLFASSPSQPPLARWQPNGKEDGSAYMLLVPADDNAVPLLQALSPDDWQRLNALAALLARQLPIEAPELGPHWPAVAESLTRQLAALPAAFRYHDLVCARAAGAPGLELRFGQVVCGARRLAAVGMRWPAAGEMAIELLLPEGAASAPPLVAWPVDAAGQPLPALMLSFTRPAGTNPAARAWAALAADDREFVCALLDRLPTIVGHAAGLPAGSDAAALATEAAALAKAARASATDEAATPRVRRLVRSLLGRSRAHG